MSRNALFELKVQDLFTRNKAMDGCLQLAALAAESDVPVLLLGESGTGKTLLAQAIHNSSARASGQFISFNASAMSDTLLESQLFGHERGAFTGAQRALKGKFELADSGTLFFDEIADMSPLAQAKVLRAVEYGEFERLGSERMLHSNARIISATNASLRDHIREGRFREDLYHRLAGLTLYLPPLRERSEDLPGLIATELHASACALGKNLSAIHPDAMAQLLNYDWPGNLRELHHVIRSIVLLCKGSEILPEHVVLQAELFRRKSALPPAHPSAWLPEKTNGFARLGTDLTLTAALHRHIKHVYDQAHGNQRETARLLGISRSRLSRHLKVILRNDASDGVEMRPI
jgi:transcriptional regulator with PAS, ATPase and Fis domain